MTVFKPGHLVKIKAKQFRKGRDASYYTYCWDQEKNNWALTQTENNWTIRISTYISNEDVGVFIKRINEDPNGGYYSRPIDIVMFNEKIVGIEFRKIRTRNVKFESRVRRVTKIDY